jgi:hypothetical protein
MLQRKLYAQIVANQAAELDASATADTMGRQCYVVTDTADGLRDGGRIRCIWLRGEVAWLPAGVITAQINGYGTSHEDVSLGFGYDG